MFPLNVAALGGAQAVLKNWAAAANGGAASASSTLGGGPNAAAAIDGSRNTQGDHAAHSWISATPGSSGTPQIVEVDFLASHTITEVDVIGLSNSADGTTDPTLSDTGTVSNLIDYKIQYWTGAAWADLYTVTGNNKIWNKLTGNPQAMTKIRISMTNSNWGGSPNSFNSLVELEAWGS